MTTSQGEALPPGDHLRGPRRWAEDPKDRLCAGAFAFSMAWRLALIPLTPALVGTRPVLLEALQGSTTAMVTAGAFVRVGRAPLWAALLAGLVGLTLFDPLVWWAGHRFGRRMLDHYARSGERNARRVRRAEGFFQRWGPWTLVIENYQPLPNGFLYVIAGATGMPVGRFIALDLIGALLWDVPAVGLGYAIGARAVAVAQTISRYSLWLAVALVAGLVAYAALQRRRGSSGRAG